MVAERFKSVSLSDVYKANVSFVLNPNAKANAQRLERKKKQGLSIVFSKKTQRRYIEKYKESIKPDTNQNHPGDTLRFTKV